MVEQQQQQISNPLFEDVQSKNLILNILNPNDIIEYVENTLLGKRLNENNQWELNQFARKIRVSGIYRTVQVLRGHLNKYQTLANLDKDDIMRMAKTIKLEMINTVYMNWEEFNYEDDLSDEPDISAYDFIVNLIDHNVFSNLTRAKDGTENKLLRTVYRSNESGSSVERTVETQGGKGNWVSNLFTKNKGQSSMEQGRY